MSALKQRSRFRAPRDPRRRLAVPLALWLILQLPASAADITVGGGCSLVDAIHSANDDSAVGGCSAGSGADTVILTGDVALTASDHTDNGGNGLPSIVSDVTIAGNGHAISRDPAAVDEFRILRVGTTGILTLNDTALVRGRTAYHPGAGIYNSAGGVVRLVGAVVDDGYGYPGAGIYNLGDLTLEDSTISNNYSYWLGGGIANVGGTVGISGSTISGNVGLGGAIFNDASGTVVLAGSTLSSNDSRGSYAINFGGGMLNGGQLSVTDSTLSDNGAYWGGAIDNGGTVDIQRTTFVDNDAVYGGAVLNSGSMSITNSTFSSNLGFATSIDNYGSGVLTVGSTTFHGQEFGTAISNDAGGSVLSLADSVIAGSELVNCDGPITDLGGNLADDASCGTIPDTLTGLDPILADNGGPTATHALLEGSSAIDHAGACGLETDQRGFLRDALCDSGSFEFGALPPPEPVGGAATGLTLHRVRCQNFTMRDNVVFNAGGSESWDCQAEGLEVEPGDNLRTTVLGIADGTSSVGGSASGQAVRNVRCQNASTGQEVPLVGAPNPWDCEAAGLSVDPGDRIRMLIGGLAD